MANDIDNMIPEGDQSPAEHSHHSTWKDIISEEFQKLNTEFPLSGGETEEALTGTHASHTDADAPAEHHEHHSIMENIVHAFQKLDTEFPLSGGETEEDFDGADDKEEGE